jgi:hypothetical protein
LASENLSNMAQAVDVMQNATGGWCRHGVDVDLAELWYLGDSNDVVDDMNARGWATTGTSVTTLAAAHGLFPPTDRDDAASGVRHAEMITGYLKDKRATGIPR